MCIFTVFDVGYLSEEFIEWHRQSFLQASDIWIQGKKITQKDIRGRNGVMHLIDGVMMPPEKKLIDLVDADSDSDIMKNMLRRAGMMLPSGFTVFVPQNIAFQELSENGQRRIKANSRAIQVSYFLIKIGHNKCYRS